jgi:hypothetical protein
MNNVKKHPTVSFRPGPALASELVKRGAEAEMSLTAKDIATKYFAMLEAERAGLQKSFSSAEIQIIVLALFDRRDETAAIETRLTAGLAESWVGKFAARVKVESEALIDKARRLTLGAKRALEDGVTQLRRLPIQEVIGPNQLPSLVVLRRLGFVGVDGPPAWGFCIVSHVRRRESPQLGHNEFVLRRNPEAVGIRQPPESADDLARRLVSASRMQFNSPSAEADSMSFALAYKIAVKTGLRRFRVDESEDGASAHIVELTPRDLTEMIDEGSLPDLVLAGVNAPEDAA